jgi:hypothetical protein
LTLPGLTSFAHQIGSIFQVIDIPPAPFDLSMTRVVEHLKTQQNESFSVFFLGPTDRFFQQGIRKLKHAQFGEMEIFLVPVGRTKDGFEYEAAFNYIHQ